jgi:hypothetical protein
MMMTPDNTKNDRFCCKRIALQKLGVIAWEEDNQETTLIMLMLCIQLLSLFNQKVRVGEGASFKDHYFVRCDYCNKKSHPHEVLNFPAFFVDWTTNHILECDNITQEKKVLVADKDLKIGFSKIRVPHFDAWDTTVCRYLQAVRSSSCLRRTLPPITG